MKRCVLIALSLCLLMGLAACGTGAPAPSEPEGMDNPVAEAPPEKPESEPQSSGSHSLVVYFSRQNNAVAGADVVASASLSTHDVTILAEFIAGAAGEADLFQIVTVEPYPADYNESTRVATAEIERDARPELATRLEDMAQYDVVYLGYPIWWGALPKPVVTFLEEYDFVGKTIVPFCTHEGSGIGGTALEIANYVPGAIVVEDGFSISGNRAAEAQDAVETWMRGLDLID